MPVTDNSVSIIIPAHNEEIAISDAIDGVIQAVNGLTDDYEIIVLNDGSRDRTADIVREKITQNNRIKLVNFEKNVGYGCVFKEGVRLASKKYFSFFHGDNDMTWQVIRDLILHIPEADIINSYLKDMKKRALGRQAISYLFVFLMNSLFAMKLRYFNGPFICSCGLLRSIPLKSSGMTIIAEAKIRLIKQGCSYKEISFEHIGRVGGKSTALSWKMLGMVISSVVVLWKDVYLAKSVSQPQVNEKVL